MPRLSSPLDAKASIRSPYALDRSQQNSCVGTVCRPAVRSAEQRPHMRFDLSLQTMMSSQVSPPSPGGPDKPFNSRCHSPGRKPSWKPVIRDRCSASSPSGGARRDRTDDLMLAKHALYQLSYGPIREAAQRELSFDLSAQGSTEEGGGPRQTRTADLTLIRRVL